MVKKALYITLTAVMVIGLMGTASAQPPASGFPGFPNDIGDVVQGDTPSGTYQGWPSLRQGTSEVGDPTSGLYDIMVNGYIEAYARVDVYDNWINFDYMDPTAGEYEAPQVRYAFTNSGNGDGVGLFGTDVEKAVDAGASQATLYDVDGSTLLFDLAGLRIQTNARLDMHIDMGSWLTRRDESGAVFAGFDTRRADTGPYQLRNQYKINFKGRFLNNLGPDDPAIDDPGTQYVSLTSGETTDYNEWTGWSPGGVVNINTADGWLEPDENLNDPWTGDATLVADADGVLLRDRVQFLDLVVERGQAQGQQGGLGSPVAGTAEAAEMWMTQRVNRRGLQDVQGNYRTDVVVELTYRESDVQWDAPVMP